MKKLAIVVFLVLAGCRRQVQVTTAPTSTTPAASTATGAATAREAVQLFLATAKSQDIQAMSGIWGTQSGPIRGTMPREQVEQRAIYIMRCLRHDSYSILDETQAKDSERVFTVQVRRGTLAPASRFIATPGPHGRWYLRDFQLEALNSICTSK